MVAFSIRYRQSDQRMKSIYDSGAVKISHAMLVSSRDNRVVNVRVRDTFILGGSSTRSRYLSNA